MVEIVSGRPPAELTRSSKTARALAGNFSRRAIGGGGITSSHCNCKVEGSAPIS